MMQDEQINYRLSVFREPDEDDDHGEFLHGYGATQGFTQFSVPPESDPEIILESALEAMGIHDLRGFSLEDTSDGGFIVRDAEHEAVAGIEIDEEACYGEGHYIDGNVAMFNALDAYDDAE